MYVYIKHMYMYRDLLLLEFGLSWHHWTCVCLLLSVLLQPLMVTQIKKVQSLIEEAANKTKTEIKECEEERYKHLVMIGNVLHPSVPISNDEVCECICVHPS